MFAKLADQFVLLHLDTRNGRADFVKQLKVERNQTYALILKPNSQEIIRLANPKKLEEIINLLKEALPKKAKREKTENLVGFTMEN